MTADIPSTWIGSPCFDCGKPTATHTAWEDGTDEIEAPSLCWGEHANCTREAQLEHVKRTARLAERSAVLAWLRRHGKCCTCGDDGCFVGVVCEIQAGAHERQEK